MSASNYERELRSILRGDKETIEIVTKTCSEDERRKYYKILKKPFIVIRAAGSYGVDLVGVRSDISLLIEIKSSKSKRMHFSSTGGKLQKQAERMKKDCERAGILPIYAFRLKNTRG
ncbi:MAG TPA: Holliday junction resolvase, partial [Candidatus Aciduliprofundum boonei]|nr:Holliday junction resolvase [Candidatus Aciduliprofundum boonei]